MQKQVQQRRSQMTNPLKGQIEVTLGSETYKARLTIDSLVKIEEELDTGILELAQNISQAKVRIKTLLVVLRYALRGGGNDFDEKQVGQIISNIGIITASTEVAKLLVATLNDNDSDEEDKKKELE